MRVVAVAIACLVFAAGPCRAADPPQNPPTTDWAPIETVVVTAQAEGPAFWHIKKGDSEIWILGTVSPLPKAMPWNSAHLAALIKGSRLVLTPPIATAGFFETSWFLLTHRGLLSMPDGKKLEDTLPPDLKARFVAARTGLALGPEKFDDDPPIVATLELQKRYNAAHDLVSDEPWETVRRLAKENHVPVKPIGEYGALGMIKEMLRLPQEGQQKCLSEALDYTEFETLHNGTLSNAWALGNLKEIKAHFAPASFGQCVKQASSFDKFIDLAVADSLKAIHDALAQPGKVVLLTDIGSLLRSTGVAEELHKEGVVIEGPAE